MARIPTEPKQTELITDEPDHNREIDTQLAYERKRQGSAHDPRCTVPSHQQWFRDKFPSYGLAGECQYR